MNPRVVRMQTTTGWGFEGDLNAAESAYERAVNIAPGSFAALSFDDFVRRLFITESERLRHGVAPDGTALVALPASVGGRSRSRHAPTRSSPPCRSSRSRRGTRWR